MLADERLASSETLWSTDPRVLRLDIRFVTFLSPSLNFAFIFPVRLAERIVGWKTPEPEWKKISLLFVLEAQDYVFDWKSEASISPRGSKTTKYPSRSFRFRDPSIISMLEGFRRPFMRLSEPGRLWRVNFSPLRLPGGIVPF